MTREVESFGDLIAPLSIGDFLADYWETTYLHLRNEPGRFSRYFSLSDLDRWLASTRNGTVFTLHPEGEGTRIEIRRVQDVAASTVYGNFTGGRAQIFKNLADWPPLQGLVKSLGREFHSDVHVNAFLTPEGARTYTTYTAHSDVVVLQLTGREVWKLHEFSVLQLAFPEGENLRFSNEWYGRRATPVLAEVRLEPGDLLFIPRGMPHHARTEAGDCLHLRVYITPMCWMGLLKIAVEQAAVHSQELRRALPPGFVGNEAICDRMRGTFEEVMRVFREVTSFDEVLAAVHRNRVALQGQPPDGHFVQLAAVAGLTADSEVERRRNVLCVVDDTVDAERRTRVTLIFGRERVNGPPRLRRAFEFVRDHDRFRVSEIPGLDQRGQLVLARRLINEGLLRRVGVPEAVAVAEPAMP